MNFNIWIQKNFRFQKEVAHILGMSTVRLSRLVNGNAKPTDRELANIKKISDGTVGERDFK